MIQLQSNMVPFIAPSVFKRAQLDPNPRLWLQTVMLDLLDADQSMTSDQRVAAGRDYVRCSQESLCEAIAEKATAYGCESNNGAEVFLNAYNSVRWCTEDEMHAWYA